MYDLMVFFLSYFVCDRL